MGIFKCKRCDKNHASYDRLRRHTSKIHKIKSSDFYIEYYLNGVRPTCKCGCGESPKFTGHGFLEWKRGHISRVHNNWGHNKTAIENSSKTRRKQYASGKRKVWNDGLTKKTSRILAKLASDISNNKERAKKISDALTGKPKSKEHVKKIKAFMQEYWSSADHREKQRENRVHWLSKHQKEEPSILENSFDALLKSNGIYGERQFEVEYKLFDFKVGDRILIEVDGDFYHCNPNRNITPIYKTQKLTLKNDLEKNIIAKRNGYKLLRFWESDIKTDPKAVIKVVLNEMKNTIK